MGATHLVAWVWSPETIHIAKSQEPKSITLVETGYISTREEEKEIFLS